MEDKKIVTLQLRLTRRNALVILAGFFLCWRPGSLGSEQLTLTTYYPAPYGGYASLLTTSQTLLARDGGMVGVGTGTTTPTSTLHVVGQGQFVVDGVGADTVGYGTLGVTRSASGSTLSYIAMTRSGNVVKAMGIDSGNRWVFGLPASGTQIIPTAQMVIEQTGNVGIGAPDPTEKLHVNGNSRIENGNLMMPANNSVGFIEGMCTLKAFAPGPQTYCPNTDMRVMGVFGNATRCQTGGSLLLDNSTDMNIPSNWIPHVEQNCSGFLLCCKVTTY
ncbi:MAG: hypothetical protein HY796_07345 [Elusimicrobia bacterium]|nr:hypothetical protein [Elusimicrobiota bacterium]